MAGPNDDSRFSFGIDTTVEVDNDKFFDDFMSPETATAAPDSITPLDKAKETKEPEKAVTKKQSSSQEVQKKEEAKEEEELDLSSIKDESEDDASDPKAKEGDDSENKKEEDEEEEPEVNIFKSLSKELVNLGILTLDEGEEDINVDSPEALKERFIYEKQKGSIELLRQQLSQFGEDYINAFNAIYVNGVHPREYFSTYNKITDFASLDMSQEENQIEVIRQHYSEQGLGNTEISAEIERIKNYGDLETVANRYHKILVSQEAKKLAKIEEESKLKIEQQREAKEQYVKNVNLTLSEKLKNKEFDGIPLNQAFAQEVQEYLTVDKYKTASGESLTEFDKDILYLRKPENHALKVKLGLLMKLLEKDPTLSTIQKTAITKKSDSLFSELSRQTSKSTTKTSSKPKLSQWFVK